MEQLLAKLKAIFDAHSITDVDMEAIKEDVVKLTTAVEQEKVKLINKNKELLGELKNQKEKVKTLELEQQKIDPIEYNRLKEEEEQRIADDPTGDGKKAKIDLESYKQKLEQRHNAEKLKLEADLKAKDDILVGRDVLINNMLIDAELEKQFVTGRKVMDEHRVMLKGYFKNQSFVELDGDVRDIYIKDPETGDDMQITDFFDSWKSSNGAKSYLEAENSSGSGASGSKKSFTKQKPFAEMTVSERGDLFRSNKEEYYRAKNGK